MLERNPWTRVEKRQASLTLVLRQPLLNRSILISTEDPLGSRGLWRT